MMGVPTAISYTGQLELPQRRNFRYVGKEVSAFALENYRCGSLGLEPIMGNEEIAALLGLESHHLGRTVRAYAPDIELARERERYLRARNIGEIRDRMSPEQREARISLITTATANRTKEEREEIGRKRARAVSAMYTDGKCEYDSQFEGIVGLALERFTPGFGLISGETQHKQLGDYTLDFFVEVAWQRFYVESHITDLRQDFVNGEEWLTVDEKTKFKRALGTYAGEDLESFIGRVERFHRKRYRDRRQAIVDEYDPGGIVVVVQNLEELYGFLMAEVNSELPDFKTFDKVCDAMKGRIRQVKR